MQTEFLSGILKTRDYLEKPGLNGKIKTFFYPIPAEMSDFT